MMNAIATASTIAIHFHRLSRLSLANSAGSFTISVRANIKPTIHAMSTHASPDCTKKTGSILPTSQGATIKVPYVVENAHSIIAFRKQQTLFIGLPTQTRRSGASAKRQPGRMWRVASSNEEATTAPRTVSTAA